MPGVKSSNKLSDLVFQFEHEYNDLTFLFGFFFL